MDEQSQFREALDAVRGLLPESVVATCEGLNDNLEWEIALSHCQYHLEQGGVPVPERAAILLAACAERFRITSTGVAPNNSFKPKPLRGSA